MALTYTRRDPVPLHPRPETVLNEAIITLGEAADLARKHGERDLMRRCLDRATRIVRLRIQLHEERQERAA